MLLFDALAHREIEWFVPVRASIVGATRTHDDQAAGLTPKNVFLTLAATTQPR